MDGTPSRTSPVEGFSINGVKSSGCATRVSIRVINFRNYHSDVIILILFHLFVVISNPEPVLPTFT